MLPVIFVGAIVYLFLPPSSTGTVALVANNIYQVDVGDACDVKD
jgi:hypothetical protein